MTAVFDTLRKTIDYLTPASGSLQACLRPALRCQALTFGPDVLDLQQPTKQGVQAGLAHCNWMICEVKQATNQCGLKILLCANDTRGDIMHYTTAPSITIAVLYAACHLCSALGMLQAPELCCGTSDICKQMCTLLQRVHSAPKPNFCKPAPGLHTHASNDTNSLLQS